MARFTMRWNGWSKGHAIDVAAIHPVVRATVDRPLDRVGRPLDRVVVERGDVVDDGAGHDCCTAGVAGPVQCAVHLVAGATDVFEHVDLAARRPPHLGPVRCRASRTPARSRRRVGSDGTHLDACRTGWANRPSVVSRDDTNRHGPYQHARPASAASGSLVIDQVSAPVESCVGLVDELELRVAPPVAPDLEPPTTSGRGSPRPTPSNSSAHTSTGGGHRRRGARAGRRAGRGRRAGGRRAGRGRARRGSRSSCWRSLPSDAAAPRRRPRALDPIRPASAAPTAPAAPAAPMPGSQGRTAITNSAPASAADTTIAAPLAPPAVRPLRSVTAPPPEPAVLPDLPVLQVLPVVPVLLLVLVSVLPGRGRRELVECGIQERRRDRRRSGRRRRRGRRIARPPRGRGRAGTATSCRHRRGTRRRTGWGRASVGAAARTQPPRARAPVGAELADRPRPSPRSPPATAPPGVAAGRRTTAQVVERRHHTAARVSDEAVAGVVDEFGVVESERFEEPFRRAPSPTARPVTCSMSRPTTK